MAPSPSRPPQSYRATLPGNERCNYRTFPHSISTVYRTFLIHYLMHLEGKVTGGGRGQRAPPSRQFCRMESVLNCCKLRI